MSELVRTFPRLLPSAAMDGFRISRFWVGNVLLLLFVVEAVLAIAVLGAAPTDRFGISVLLLTNTLGFVALWRSFLPLPRYAGTAPQV